MSTNSFLFFDKACRPGVLNLWAVDHYWSVAYLQPGHVNGWLVHVHACIAPLVHITGTHCLTHVSVVGARGPTRMST